MADDILQFAGSLIAILALSLIARRLHLGRAPRLAGEAEARAAAAEAVEGYAAVAIALDKNGHGALLRDGEGRIMLLRAHGAHFVGRILPPEASVRIDGDAIIVDAGERPFGATRLAIGDASAWVQAIGSKGEPAHA